MPELHEGGRLSGSFYDSGMGGEIAGAGSAEPITIARLLEQHDRPARASAAKPRLRLLARTVDLQIVPKLVLAHRIDGAVLSDPARAPVVDAEEIASFTELVLVNDVSGCRARVDERVTQGADLAHICLDLLTPAARRLGDLWEEDLCSFADVTAGLGTLQTVLHMLHESCEPAAPFTDPTRRALLVSLPGEQHTFGLQVVAELFHHSGWDVTVEPACDDARLGQLVSSSHYAIVGLSTADEAHLNALALAIRTVHRASANHAIGVLVGGPVFSKRPELATLIGADVACADAQQAVLRAEGLRLLAATLRHEHEHGRRQARG